MTGSCDSFASKLRSCDSFASKLGSCDLLVGGTRIPLYAEVSSFQGFGIEGFLCKQRCPHFRVLE